MNDLAFIISALLSIFTFGVMFLYYVRLREASREYRKAKSAVSDIVLSFNRDLQRQEEKIRELLNKSDEFSAQNLRVIEDLKSKILGIKAELGDALRIKETPSTNYDYLNRRIEELLSNQKMVTEKIEELEALRHREISLPEARVEPAIPIRRERALAPLTETELRILEILASEGEMTAPQIRDKIKLTREHTARLMKMLYLRGYVERRTERMPFGYRVKKEMQDILG